MISSLTGTVRHVGLHSAVIDVGGFGMLVHATPRTLSGLHVGREASVETSMVVREDSMTLFGFSDAAEREVFEVITGVSGIGPRLGLSILAVHTPEDVRIAATAGDVKAFTRVPGIGPKGAQRIVLELAGKLVPTGEPAAAAGGTGEQPWKGQVLEALVGLGWTEKDAGKAIDATVEAEPEAVEAGDVGQILRTVLRGLGRGSARTGR